MELSRVLWENWENWASGGLEEAFLEEHTSAEDREKLLKWLDHAYQKLDQVRPLLRLKAVVDIAAWCLHGTHSLDLWPRELRFKEYHRQAASLGVTTEILIELSITSSELSD
jgi:hypothetical protein